MTHAYHTESYKGLKISIFQDDDPMNPFVECDGEPDIITFMRRHDFTTRKEDSGLDPESFLKKAKAGNYFVRPLYAYIHSGIAFSLSRDGQFTDRFDSGFAGFMFWTPKKRESLGLSDSYIDSILQENETRESWLVNSLESAVEVLNDYTNGNCYFYTVENAEGETLDSCGGFLGDYDSEGGALSEARSSADCHAKQETEKEKETILQATIRIQEVAEVLDSEMLAGLKSESVLTRLAEKEHAEAQKEKDQATARLAALESESEGEGENA